MFVLSAEAEKELKRRLKELDGCLGVRIKASGTSDVKFELVYEMPLTSKEKRKGKQEPQFDKIIRMSDVIFFIDPRSAIYLEGLRLDYAEMIGQDGSFRFSYPKEH